MDTAIKKILFEMSSGNECVLRRLDHQADILIDISKILAEFIKEWKEYVGGELASPHPPAQDTNKNYQKYTTSSTNGVAF